MSHWQRNGDVHGAGVAGRLDSTDVGRLGAEKVSALMGEEGTARGPPAPAAIDRDAGRLDAGAEE